jgi:hypothetical protein
MVRFRQTGLPAPLDLEVPAHKWWRGADKSRGETMNPCRIFLKRYITGDTPNIWTRIS